MTDRRAASSPARRGVRGLLLAAAGALAAAALAVATVPADAVAPAPHRAAQPSPTDGPSTGATPAGPTPSATPSSEVDPPLTPTVPRAGDCWRLSFEAAGASTAQGSPVPCGRRHTTRTLTVATLPAYDRGHLLSVTADPVQRRVAAACRRDFVAYVGGTREARDLSLLRPVWFSPTPDAVAEGSSWTRCDATLLAREGSLAGLPGLSRGTLGTAAGQRRFGTCSRAAPDQPHFARRTCTAPHRWRAVALVRAGSGKDYPGARRVRSTSSDRCDREVRRRTSTARYTFSVEYPRGADWRAGRRRATCWVPDRR